MQESIDAHIGGLWVMFRMALRKHKNHILGLDEFVIPAVPYND